MWRDTAYGRLLASAALRKNLVFLWHPAAGLIYHNNLATYTVTRQADNRLVRVEDDDYATRSFNAGNDYVDIASAGGMQGVDVHSWFYRARWLGNTQDGGFGASDFGIILSRQSNGLFSHFIASINNPDPASGCIRYKPDFNFGSAVVGNTPVGSTRWRNVMFSQSASVLDAYLDGKKDGTAANSASTYSNSVTPLSIGGWPGDGSGWSSADVGMVAGWNVALAAVHAEELQELISWRRRRTYFVAAGGGAFQPAWAVRNNVVLGRGAIR